MITILLTYEIICSIGMLLYLLYSDYNPMNLGNIISLFDVFAAAFISILFGWAIVPLFIMTNIKFRRK